MRKGRVSRAQICCKGISDSVDTILTVLPGHSDMVMVGVGVKGQETWTHDLDLLRQLPVYGRGILHPGVSPEQPRGDS